MEELLNRLGMNIVCAGGSLSVSEAVGLSAIDLGDGVIWDSPGTPDWLGVSVVVESNLGFFVACNVQPTTNKHRKMIRLIVRRVLPFFIIDTPGGNTTTMGNKKVHH